LNLTIFDIVEIAAVTWLGAYAWNSPIRLAAVSTVFALGVFHGMARFYIGLYGPGLEAAYAVAVMASVIAGAHLFFRYTTLGLLTGILFALIPLFTGFAAKGWVVITFQQGPGRDYWTLVSCAAWLVWLVLAIGIRRARNAVG
jgi:hypothetical protein